MSSKNLILSPRPIFIIHCLKEINQQDCCILLVLLSFISIICRRGVSRRFAPATTPWWVLLQPDGLAFVPSAVYISLKHHLAWSSSLCSCGFFSPFGRDSSQDAGGAFLVALLLRPLRGGSSPSRTG